jgi:hypothetical protein
MRAIQRYAVAAAMLVGCVVVDPPALRTTVLTAAEGAQLSFDVAMDARTWRMESGDNPFFPALTGAVYRGNTFVVNGTIYPAGTLPEGGDFASPSQAGPDMPGSIGTWVCRGVFNLDWTDIVTGTVPHVTSTQFYNFDNGNTLISDGPEGGTAVVRAVIGGTGALSGAAGQLEEVPLGVNFTNLFNLRFTVKLEKQAPK